MKRISATEVARNLSDVLDAIERRHESFLVTRGGRLVARLGPATAGTGSALKDALRGVDLDPDWARELADLRSGSVAEDRVWRD